MVQEVAATRQHRPVVAGAEHNGRRNGRGAAGGPPIAIVMGDADVVRALGMAGVSCAIYDRACEPGRHSRHVRHVLPWIDEAAGPDGMVETLLAFARTQPEPPVLIQQSDDALLLLSRRREQLRDAFRFTVGDAELIEQLADKARFQELAERHDLPVPRATRLRPSPDEVPPELGLRFPVVLKPIRRGDRWEAIAGGQKAFHAADAAQLAEVWPLLAEARCEILAQESVPGPETAIESFHVYIDEDGAVAGSFTGRKLRTYPTRYGHSTAVEVTHLPDVARLGHEVLDRIGFRGVAKVDFKRDGRGLLSLLEINARFNLWHLPGAVAGVNLPALVYADLTGSPRPPASPLRASVTWCRPLRDVRAAYVAGIPPLQWLRWARGCDVLSGLSREDPMPFLRGTLPATVGNQLSRPVRATLARGGRRAG
jgi:predicted ATP-grasp superfamily ATP-dependent carboligase